MDTHDGDDRIGDDRSGEGRSGEGRSGEDCAGLEDALTRQTLLLQEIDHRTKNNLQLISSLLLLQSRRTRDPGAQAALRGMLERVSAIAQVHRRLFQGGEAQRFEFADFLRDLARELAGAARRDDLELRLTLDPVDVPASQAAPLALVASELISNACRHAYPDGTPGLVAVDLRRWDGAFELTVSDGGAGMPTEGGETGFGLTVARLMAQQLKGKLVIEAANPGVRANLAVPETA
jgi:two-component sensor histidine kinase